MLFFWGIYQNYALYLSGNHYLAQKNGLDKLRSLVDFHSLLRLTKLALCVSKGFLCANIQTKKTYTVNPRFMRPRFKRNLDLRE